MSALGWVAIMEGGKEFPFRLAETFGQRSRVTRIALTQIGVIGIMPETKTRTGDIYVVVGIKTRPDGQLVPVLRAAPARR